jgi:hypothetical protein
MRIVGLADSRGFFSLLCDPKEVRIIAVKSVA